MRYMVHSSDKGSGRYLLRGLQALIAGAWGALLLGILLVGVTLHLLGASGVTATETVQLLGELGVL